ncbi:MAG: tripartite tricarboxylate transporter substrate binding protein [Oscillospiraceae bacterium]|nr:tripartite tricarboxylate transporter substrate binding protein [Oscillospiraceae bacterium]
MKKLLAILLAVVMVVCLSATAFADYPDKGINVICPWGAGGGTDNCLRAFCAALEKQLGVTLTVDNLTGAGGVIGHEAIADAEPDGYTFGMITWELPSYLPQDMSEYTYESYIPLCRVNTDASAITVNTKWAADNGVTDLASFIAYCKDHPGEVTMGGSSSGSVWHVGGGYLMNAAGIDIKMITYSDGAASAAKAAAQGEITGVTISAAEARSFVEAGDLTMLGIMSAERNSVFPDVPTCQEEGYDLIWGTWRGLALPLGTDEEVVKVLSDACAAAIEDPDFVEFMKNAGQTISYLNAEEYTEFLAQETENVPAAMVAVGLIEE